MTKTLRRRNLLPLVVHSEDTFRWDRDGIAAHPSSSRYVHLPCTVEGPPRLPVNKTRLNIGSLVHSRETRCSVYHVQFVSNHFNRLCSLIANVHI